MAEYLDPADPAATELVRQGELEVEGRLVEASNATLVCRLSLDGVTARAVYKPVAGERPLWDFPDGTLAGREAATYWIAQASGLGNLPPTVLRDGPFGRGMVQLWVETREEALVEVCAPEKVPPEWRVVLHAQDPSGEPVVLAHSADAGVRDLAVLDIVVNNTDRKGGHVLPGVDGRVYGVDHGICLHREPKLRTVLWGWVGEPLPDEVVDKLKVLRRSFDHELGESLAGQLTVAEREALVRRTDALLAAGVFPEPGEDWQAIPWPLF